MADGNICAVEYWIADELWMLARNPQTTRAHFVATVARLLNAPSSETRRRKRRRVNSGPADAEKPTTPTPS